MLTCLPEPDDQMILSHMSFVLSAPAHDDSTPLLAQFWFYNQVACVGSFTGMVESCALRCFSHIFSGVFLVPDYACTTSSSKLDVAVQLANIIDRYAK